MKIREVQLGGIDKSVPTLVGVPIQSGGTFLFGRDALQADGSTHLLLSNWKLLLGRTALSLSKERLDSPILDRILSLFSLDEITERYFSHVLATISQQDALLQKPQCIIGIPAAGLAESEAARARYKRIIRAAFKRLKCPKPAFFPEPFSVFQHHLNRGDIGDVGHSQNVLVIDIGGGTTNICAIRTSGHGRIARGGVNHTPHGVTTIEIGGATIDQGLLDRTVKSTRVRDSRALIKMGSIKESLSNAINVEAAWTLPQAAARQIRRIDLEGQGAWEVTGSDLVHVIEYGFWPHVKAALEECLDALSKLGDLFKSIDSVILAGGTCQSRIFDTLVRRDFGDRANLKSARIIVSPDYRVAVSSGLVIEACANSRLHSVRPTRIAPYIYSPLRLLLSQGAEPLAYAHELRPGDSNIFPRFLDGMLLPGSVSLSELSNRKQQWRAKLKQDPASINFLLALDADDDSETPRFPSKLKVKRKGLNASRNIGFSILFHEDGVADLTFETNYGGERDAVSHDGGRLDLHDLHGLDGEVFVGIDFGTSSTLVSIAKPSDAALEPLPSKYSVSDAIQRRAIDLEQRAKALVEKARDATALLRADDRLVLSDYVYHSNRIEGSLLSRGQTRDVLGSIADSPTVGASTLQRYIEQFNFIDEEGQVKTASRPIKDGIAAINLRDAFNFSRDCAVEGRALTVFSLKELHGLIMRGETEAGPGQFRKGPVQISQTAFVPPDAMQIATLMDEMVSSWQDFSIQSAICKSAIAHAHFVSIHPFHDGNGRLARLIANYFLWIQKLPAIMLPWENRDRYYDALEECNSNEVSKRGDVSELASLFCDLFEDSISRLEFNLSDEREAEPHHDSVESTITQAAASRSPRLNDLLSRIGSQRRSVDLESQYDSFRLSFSSLLAEAQANIELLNQSFREGWGGRAVIREFPVIDLDTYRNIRFGRPFSRTWFFALNMRLPKSWQEVVFFFGRTSAMFREQDEKFVSNVSLFAARYDTEEGAHIRLHDEKWSRLKEFAHDGAALTAGLVVDGNNQFIRSDEADFVDWLALMIEDAIENLDGSDI